MVKAIRNNSNIISVVGLIAGLAACAEAEPYATLAQEAVEKVHLELIKMGVCQDIGDCRASERVFFEAGGGVFISVYGIADQNTVDAIKSIVCKAHQSNVDVNYSVVVYSAAHRTDVNRTSLNYIFRGGENAKC